MISNDESLQPDDQATPKDVLSSHDPEVHTLQERQATTIKIYISTTASSVPAAEATVQPEPVVPDESRPELNHSGSPVTVVASTAVSTSPADAPNHNEGTTIRIPLSDTPTVNTVENTGVPTTQKTSKSPIFVTGGRPTSKDSDDEVSRTRSPGTLPHATSKNDSARSTHNGPSSAENPVSTASADGQESSSTVLSGQSVHDSGIVSPPATNVVTTLSDTASLGQASPVVDAPPTDGVSFVDSIPSSGVPLASQPLTLSESGLTTHPTASGPALSKSSNPGGDTETQPSGGQPNLPVSSNTAPSSLVPVEPPIVPPSVNGSPGWSSVSQHEDASSKDRKSVV